MLILTRRVGEKIMVGEDIEITILESKGNQVRVGVDAPRDIPVHRKEIYKKIKKQEELEDVARAYMGEKP